MEDPTSGSIVFKGVDIADMKVDISVHRRHMGMVFQHFNLFNNKTVLQNVMMAPAYLQRKDLHYLEEAEAIAAFLHQTGMTQEAVAAQLGMSPSALANKLRLLRLSPACRALLVEHGLTERHARCLLRLEDEGERLTALRQAAAKHWNVAQTEQYVERRLAALQTAPPAGRRTYIIKDVRLFLNSVDRGLRLIRDAGVDARTEREETEDEIVLTLRIPKQRRKEA